MFSIVRREKKNLSLGMKNGLYGFMQTFGIKKNVAIFYN